MRVGILYIIDPSTTAAALLAEFAGGTLHGRTITSTCQFYASDGRALFLGPAGSFGYDDWLEGDSEIMTMAASYDGVIAEMTMLDPVVAVLVAG
jgi:hypothetical protein